MKNKFLFKVDNQYLFSCVYCIIKFFFKFDYHFLNSLGLVIMPVIPLEDYDGPRDVYLLLKKPNGSHVIEPAEIFYSFPVPTPNKKMFTVLLKHLKKEDVPI